MTRRAFPAGIGCGSSNHKGPREKVMRGSLPWQCERCSRWFCSACSGGADDFEDACDDCWAVLTKERNDPVDLSEYMTAQEIADAQQRLSLAKTTDGTK